LPGNPGGDFFRQIAERLLLQLCALGKSDKIRVGNTFTTFANGSNVAVASDLVRRTIRCELDTNVANPECRTQRPFLPAISHRSLMTMPLASSTDRNPTQRAVGAWLPIFSVAPGVLLFGGSGLRSSAQVALACAAQL
jgi:hypothetical protein